MNPHLKKHFENEIGLAISAMNNSENTLAWTHFSRAHILGQFYVWPHLKVHLWMFLFGLKTFNIQEIIGQIPRLILAAPGSIFKKAPLGNTGLSNVGIFQPMPIPSDLIQILKENK